MRLSTVCRATGTTGVAVLAVLLASGTSYAFLSTTGTGSGAASTGTVTLTASTVAGAGLYPGGSAAVSVTVTNTSASARLVVISIAGSGTSVTGGKGTCDPSVVSFTVGSLPGTSIAPGASASYSGTVAMTAAAGDGCQSGSFTVPLHVTGQAG